MRRLPVADVGQVGLGESLPIPSKVLLALEILTVYAWARWLMTRRDLRAALAALRVGGQNAPEPTAAAAHTGRRLGGAIGKTVGRLPADSRCLVRSLVLTGLLARRGIRSTLVLAVQPGSSFAAHAWVEYEGEPLLWTGGARYQRLAEL